MRILFFTLLLILTATVKSQDTTLSLLFTGDIMGHDSQIHSAHQPDGTYNYSEVFKYVSKVISNVDIAVANLEVTLAGSPFKGYPQFSSPDALALAAKQAGFDILCTANNHSVDRRKHGVIRTIKVLDSLNISHTGTFVSKSEREEKYPLIINKNGLKIALLNYTYGTNGIPVPSPVIVNLIDTTAIKSDLKKAKKYNPNIVIVFIHWGSEYQHHPNIIQKNIAKFCFNNGADFIIGSHPHVIQKSEILQDSSRFITYSLGNFISNQRKRYTDGGQMIKIVIKKQNEKIVINKCGYILTWVYTPVIKGKKHFYILPASEFEMTPDFFVSQEHYNRMKLFIKDSRELLNSYNKNVGEYLYYNGNWNAPE
jgi:poly-gamma-glutamate synthesis protein (capsule biosynthesis protein)